MYQAHFGLKKTLFEGGIAQEDAVFLGPRQQLIAANFKVALTTLDSAVVLTGPPGVGKTTLTCAALRATTTRLALGWITNTPANAHELLELLLTEFGFNAHRVGRVERLQMWRQFLNETAATNSRVFVIAECAEEQPQEQLRALDALTAADGTGTSGANLVLLGHAVLEEHLKAPVLDSLCQRIRLRQRLDPVSLDELKAYLAHRIARAGGEFDKVLTPDAVAALFEHSGGILRVVNNLCETSLTLAATRREPRLTGQLVNRVASSLFGLNKGAPPPPKPQPGAAVGEAPSAASSGVAPTSAAASIPGPASAPASAVSTPSQPPPLPAAVPTNPAPSAAAPRPTAAPPTAEAPAAPLGSRPAAPLPTSPAVGDVQGLAESEAAGPVPSAAGGAARAPASVAPEPAPATDDDVITQTDLDPIEDDFALNTATDIPDVALMDFPVLTDEVADEQESWPPSEPQNAPVPSTPRAPAASSPPSPPSPVLGARADASDAANVASRPVAGGLAAAARRKPSAGASPPKPAPPMPPKAPPAQPAAAPRPAAAAPPAAPPAAAPAPRSGQGRSPVAPKEAPTDDELLHQTATMRALASAKSIDDVSDSMAETLFGDADLDMLSAALASAGWSDDEEPPGATPAPASASTTTTGPRPVADELDIFGFSSPPSLEIIDEEPTPDGDAPHKVAARR